MLDDKDKILPARFRNAPHLAAFEQIWHDRVESIDISLFMMNLVDACSYKGLPYLAEQFGILTLRSWKLATSDDERRQLIKDAIATRASYGTVAAVKAAIASLGFDPAHLVERCGTDPVTGWAEFKIAFDASEITLLDGPMLDLLYQLIVDSKPARCKFLGLEYSATDLVDTLSPTDIVDAGVGADIVDALPLPGLKYDGAKKYDGSQKYRSPSELVQYTIV